jgi:hypothetical protein
VTIRLTTSASGGTPHSIQADLGGVTAVWTVTTATPTGAFVLSSASHLGDFGGLAGADSFCLSDLTANNWLNKANFTLDSAHVKSFLCTNTTCNNLLANTNYQFALSGSPGTGGAVFTTNGSGRGPGDANAWTDSTRFNNTAGYFTNRGNFVDQTLWDTVPAGGNSCVNWTSSAGGGNVGTIGSPGATNRSRWAASSATCDAGGSYRVICYVNP